MLPDSETMTDADEWLKVSSERPAGRRKIEADQAKALEMIAADEAKARKKAIGRGHSTVQMAAEFAERIGAGVLVFNHLSSR